MKVLISERQYSSLLFLLKETSVELPKKAELVKSDLNDFYSTLETAAKKGGLKQQSYRSMTFQKEVESLQIGLNFLGYELPKYGIDGLFGPETVSAVRKFIKDNVKSDKKSSINEASSSVGPFRTDLENSPIHHSKRAFGNWQSDNAWDLFAPIGVKVNSFTKGRVTSVRESSGKNPKIYGTQINIKGLDGFPDIFYTHVENVKLKVGDLVDVGDFIGTIKEWPGHKATHVHIGLQRGSHLKDLLVNSDKIFSGTGEISPVLSNGSTSGVSDDSEVVATPEMILKLIEMLKSKNITASDIKNYKKSYSGEGVSDGPTITGNIILKGPFNGQQRRNISYLVDEMIKNGIKNPYVQVGILSVIGKESGFVPKSEMSYATSSNQRIRNIFGSRVSKYSDSELDRLKSNEKDFFNTVYAKSIGNQGGNHGWLYRGRGFNQLTGIKNYEKYGRLIGVGDDLVKNPELVNDIEVASKIAITFFTKGKSADSIPNFNNKEDAVKYFADINAGGRSSRARSSALATSSKFDVKGNSSQSSV